MSYVVHSDRTGPAALQYVRRFADSLRGALKAALRRAAAASRYAAARRDFNRLDDAALRDLGISRDEFDSYWAESLGRADQTRRRVMQHFHGRPL